MLKRGSLNIPPKLLIGAAMLLTLLVYVVYAYWQPIYTYSLLDPRFDAHQYLRAYSYFKQHTTTYELGFPFNARILGPWLAAQLPVGNAPMAFRWVNGFFLVLSAGVLTAIWQQLRLRTSLIFVGLFWFLFHWKGPLRMYLPDPANADVPLYFFGVVWLYLILRIATKNTISLSNQLLLGALTVLGSLQKEVFLVIMGATWAFFLIQKRTAHWFLLGCLVVGIGAHLVADWFFAATHTDWRNTGFVTLLRGIKRYFAQPQLLLRLPVSGLLAYGFLWLGWPKQRSSFTMQYLQAMTFIWFILSVLGGGDTTRIFVNGLPFVLTCCLLRLQELPLWVGYFAVGVSLPLMRLGQLEPDLGLQPAQAYQWCVECWEWSQSWPYWVYGALMLAAYHQLTRRLGAAAAIHKSDKI
jgi:hypothetical protein